MQLGMIGLGRMGANMVRRLLKAGHQCVAFDMSPKAVDDLAKEGAIGASSLQDFVKKLATENTTAADPKATPAARADRSTRPRCWPSGPTSASTCGATSAR